MIYRLGDNAPDLEWLINKDITAALITATYTKSDNDVIASICTSTLEVDEKGNPQTRIVHSWGIDDLDVLGIGKIQLTWATMTESGYIAPASGWRIEVVALDLGSYQPFTKSIPAFTLYRIIRINPTKIITSYSINISSMYEVTD